MYGVTFNQKVSVIDFGTIPDFFQWQMLVHPDMIGLPIFEDCTIIPDALTAIPTSSSRTVKVAGNNQWFLKLNYRGLIGRIDRSLHFQHALAAIEVSQIIQAAISAKKLPDSFYFLLETFARVINVEVEGVEEQWGIVARELMPYPNNGKVKYLIPAFSLFAPDDKHPADEPLLIQFIRRQQMPVEEYLFEKLIKQLYDAYFQLLLKCGLQLESHAQNSLYAVVGRLTNNRL